MTNDNIQPFRLVDSPVSRERTIYKISCSGTDCILPVTIGLPVGNRYRFFGNTDVCNIMRINALIARAGGLPFGSSLNPNPVLFNFKLTSKGELNRIL